MIQRLISFLLIFCSFLVNLNAQSVYGKKLKFITPKDYERWALLDDFNFEKINNWNFSETTTIEENKNVAPRVGKAFYRKISPGVTFRKIKSERFLTEEYQNNPSCLGFKVFFPEFVSERIMLLPKENYKFEGNCRKISFWLLGRGKNIDFEIIIKDYRGDSYFLPVTKLDFLGWKYFEVNITKSIEKNYNVYVQKKIVELSGFIVFNHPAQYSDELYGPEYIYIDQLEFYSDQYQNIYPGLEISDNW